MEEGDDLFRRRKPRLLGTEPTGEVEREREREWEWEGEWEGEGAAGNSDTCGRARSVETSEKAATRTIGFLLNSSRVSSPLLPALPSIRRLETQPRVTCHSSLSFP